MNISLNHDPSLEPSIPPGGRVNTIRLWVGLFGAPVAWIAQVFLSEPLAAYACYPYQTPLSAPIWERLPVMLMTISIVCLAVALLSGFVAWTLWRQSERKLPLARGECQRSKPVFSEIKRDVEFHLHRCDYIQHLCSFVGAAMQLMVLIVMPATGAS